MTSDRIFRNAYSLISAGETVKEACKKAKTSRSSYYRWLSEHPDVEDQQKKFAINAIRCALADCDGVCENCPWEEGSGLSMAEVLRAALSAILGEKKNLNE